MFPTIFQRNDAIKRFSRGNDKKERMLESGWEQSRIDHWVDQNETRCDTLILEKKRNNKTGYRKRHGERRQFILGWYTRKRGIATIFHLSAIYSHSGRVSRLLLPFSFPLSRDTCLEFFKRGKKFDQVFASKIWTTYASHTFLLLVGKNYIACLWNA